MKRNEIMNNIYRTMKDVAETYNLKLRKNVLVSIEYNNSNTIFLEYSRGDKKYYLSSCGADGEVNYKYFNYSIELVKEKMIDVINNQVEYYNF